MESGKPGELLFSQELSIATYGIIFSKDGVGFQFPMLGQVIDVSFFVPVKRRFIDVRRLYTWSGFESLAPQASK